MDAHRSRITGGTIQHCATTQSSPAFPVETNPMARKPTNASTNSSSSLGGGSRPLSISACVIALSVVQCRRGNCSRQGRLPSSHTSSNSVHKRSHSLTPVRSLSGNHARPPMSMHTIRALAHTALTFPPPESSTVISMPHGRVISASADRISAIDAGNDCAVHRKVGLLISPRTALPPNRMRAPIATLSPPQRGPTPQQTLLEIARSTQGRTTPRPLVSAQEPVINTFLLDCPCYTLCHSTRNLIYSCRRSLTRFPY